MKTQSKLKLFIFDLFDRDEISGNTERALNFFLMSMIILNVTAVVIEPSFTASHELQFFRYFEIFSVIVFSIEYLIRFWVSDIYYPELPAWKARLRYVISGMAIIDMLAILPFYIPFLLPVDLRVLRSLRLFRLLRLFKANRYVKSLHIVISVIRNKSSELISSIAVVLVLMLIAATVMFNFENAAQPDIFENMFDALWWATATLTTVGYGDIYPVTAVGKLFAGLIALLGVGIVAIPTGIIASGFSEHISEEKAAADKSNFCHHCGKPLK